MIFGEHAVLYGKRALACAIDRRIKATLSLRSDDTITIHSALGTYQTSRHHIDALHELRFVLAAIKSKPLTSGFDLVIESEFSHLFGLGSSAAVTVATLGALNLWLEQTLTKERLFEESLQIVRSVQSVASGADVAASVYGGIVAYSMAPGGIEKLPHLFPLTVVYSGSKRATVEVIALVKQSYDQSSDLFEHLFSAMDFISLQAQKAILAQDWKKVGNLLCVQQGLMDAIGVNNKILSEIAYALRACPEILGSKISGSGLGDCVIGLGHTSSLSTRFPQLHVDMSAEGISLL